jgi:hypothetical protein
MKDVTLSKPASAFGPTHAVDLNPFSATFLAEIPRSRVDAGRAALATFLVRTLLVLVVATGSATAPLFAHAANTSPAALTPTPTYVLTAKDTELLEQVQRRAIQFFIEHTDANSGLTRDRAPTDGSPSSSASSVAANGFALSAWCIAEARGWMSYDEALTRVLRTLRFVARHHAHERGLLYHFVDAQTGQRAWNSEASTIDTALFLKGALFAREYFRDPEVTRLVDQIYRRIDWQWALNGGTTLSHGWLPESGFIPHRWDSYSELMGMYLLAIGTHEKAIAPETWHAWQRAPLAWHQGRAFIQCGPLFTHQFAHGWFDFRGQRDAYADYWQNSTDATLAQRAWSAMQTSRYEHWSADMWGLTASDGPRGYMAWGTPGLEPDQSDGTVVPCAPGGSLPFAPRECLTALHRMRDVGGDAIWGRYGFADAFNPQTGWVASDVIGIDLGIMLVMAENLRSELVWRTFMRAAEVQRGMKLAGFKPARNGAQDTSVAASKIKREGDSGG